MRSGSRHRRLFRRLLTRAARAVRPSARPMRAAAVFAYLLVSSGAPIPAFAAVQSPSDDPFPCMGNRCGCGTARECWTSCCCRNAAERVAWAFEHGVKVPDYAVLPSQTTLEQLLACWGEEKADLLPANARMNGVVCDRKEHPSACCCCHHDEAPKPTAGQSKPSRSVVALEALKCRGVGDAWLLLSLTSLPPPAAPTPNDGQGFATTLCLTSLPGPIVPFPPPAPPPR